MRPFPTRLCHVRKNKTVQLVWPKWTMSLHEDMDHYRMRSNLGVLYFLRKKRERALYVGSLFKMSWGLFPLGYVSREGELNYTACVAKANNIMTLGYESLQMALKPLSNQKVWVLHVRTWVPVMGWIVKEQRKKKSWTPTSPRKERRSVLYVGSLSKMSWGLFPWGYVSWGRIKMCGLCGKSGKNYDTRIYVVA